MLPVGTRRTDLPGRRESASSTALASHSAAARDGWLSRERALALALVVASGVVFYLCYRLVLPFLPALAWAVALAIIAHPVHRWIHRRVPYQNVAAALAVIVVTLAVVLPVIFVSHALISQAEKYSNEVQSHITDGKWREMLSEHPLTSRFVPWIDAQLGWTDPAADRPDSSVDRDPGEVSGAVLPQSHLDDPAVRSDESVAAENLSPDEGRTIPTPTAESVERAATLLGGGVSTLVGGAVWLGMQLLITLLSLFFFFRDRRSVVAVLRSLMPLSEHETDEVFERVSDTVHGTLYGSVVVAMVQGTLGGLMFWWLGLPAPLLWGAVMALLATVPFLGTFVVWAPTAIYLGLSGDWFRAIILGVWGAIAISLIDNLLYPYLVGKQLRFHTLLVFFALVGGVALFGASGLILGPLILAIADALLEVWRRRTAFGGTIEAGVCEEPG